MRRRPRPILCGFQPGRCLAIPRVVSPRIIHFEVCLAERVFDASALDEGLETAGDFGRGSRRGLAFAEEAVDVGALDFDGGGAGELLVKAGQQLFVFEDDVGGEFGLIDAPLEVVAQAFVQGDPAGGVAVEDGLDFLRVNRVGKALGAREVGDMGEAVVGLGVTDARRLELAFEPVVAVETELEAEGRPGGNAQVAEAEHRIDEIDVGQDRRPIRRCRTARCGQSTRWFP